MSLKLRTISLKDANAFVEQLHRHHPKVQGHKFSLAVLDNDKVVGVAIVGRPVSRVLDDGSRLEVTRLCTDGTFNACSFLYGAAAKAAWALGYESIGTYILESELGTSLRASNYSFVRNTKGHSWNSKSRQRTDKSPTVNKQYWERLK